MSIKKLKEELEKVEDKQEKERIIKDYAERKWIGCGKYTILLFLFLIILAMLVGLIAFIVFCIRSMF